MRRLVITVLLLAAAIVALGSVPILDEDGFEALLGERSHA